MEWVNYLFNITEEGYYSVSANLFTNNQLEHVNWWFDGEQSYVTNLENFKDESRDVGPVIFFLKPGLHTLRINAGAEGWVINSVSLNKSETADDDQSSASSFNFSLEQNYPNPFNLSTDIAYSIPEKGNVILEIFDTLGRNVRVLVNGEFNPGAYHLQWDGRDSMGHAVSSGVYFYRLSLRSKIRLTKKMYLMK